MMDTKEMLIYAAKAAGYNYRETQTGLFVHEESQREGFWFDPISIRWQAWDLAERIGAIVDFEHKTAATKNHMAKADTAQLAVVKLAAEIGRAME